MASATTGAGLHDISVDIPLLMDHPKTALLGVLQLLGEGWETAIEADITVEQFSGAMTNMVYRCGLMKSGKEVQVVLMRVHASSSDLFDRQAEIDTFKGVSRAGLGPRLLLLFQNGRVEEFLGQHVTLAAADIHDPAVSAAIAATLATFHSKLSGVMSGRAASGAAVQLWDRLRLWLKLTQQVSTLSELQQLGMAGLEQEISKLEQQLTQQHPCWVAFCHNDLQYGNIMAALSPEDAAAAAAGPAGVEGSSSSSGGLVQQLGALGLSDAGAAAALAAQKGISPRQQLLQAPAGPAAARSPGSIGGSDDAASQSNLSQAGSTAPSVSSLSAFSAASASVTATNAAASGSKTTLAAAAAARSDSSSSLQVLGRSPHRTVQLPDGSLVLPGMRARPRGQSPEPARGKRPDLCGGSFSGALGGTSRASSISSSGPLAIGARGRAPEGGPSVAAGGSSSGSRHREAAAVAAAGSSAGHSSRSRLGGLELQAPSAAAVMRHASTDEGDLLLGLMPDDSADAGLTRRGRVSHADSGSGRRGRGRAGSDAGSSSGSESDSSLSSSPGGDGLLLVPPHLRPQRHQGVRGLMSGAAPAAAKSARNYREVRKARLQPAEGFDFPTCITSDQDSASGGDSSSLADDSSDEEAPTAAHGPPAQYARGRSPPSRRSSKPAAGAAAAAATAPSTAAAAGGRAAAAPQSLQQQQAGPAAGAAAGRRSTTPVAAAVSRTCSDEDTGEARSCLTFIDYEYSGFNPVAYDIANHWCEWAADYHTDEPAVLDFSKLPDPQQQLLFVEAYLRALLTKHGVQLPQAAAAAGTDGGDSRGAAAAARSPAGAASPEPAGLSSLAGFKPPAGLNPDSSRRSEAAWSTLSSRGGSVVSFPDPDAGWETASQGSAAVMGSSRVQKADAGAMEPVGDGQPTAAAAAAGSSHSGGKAGPGSQDLSDFWAWLQQDSRLSTSSSGGSNGSSRQLDDTAWQQLVSEVVAAADAYTAASHLLWALWGVIQSKVSDVDFDFMGYAQQRWRMYLQTRPVALRHA